MTKENQINLLRLRALRRESIKDLLIARKTKDDFKWSYQKSRLSTLNQVFWMIQDSERFFSL